MSADGASSDSPEGGATDVVARLRVLERELARLRAAVASTTTSVRSLPSGEFQLLRFVVGGQAFGVELGAIAEIVRVARLLRIGTDSRTILGLLNLRGAAIPIVDLGARLHGERTKWTLATPIVVVRAGGRAFGLVVDAVRDVVDVPASTNRPRVEVPHADVCVAAVLELDAELVQVVDVEAMWDGELSAVVERTAGEPIGSAGDRVEGDDVRGE